MCHGQDILSVYGDRGVVVKNTIDSGESTPLHFDGGYMILRMIEIEEQIRKIRVSLRCPPFRRILRSICR